MAKSIINKFNNANSKVGEVDLAVTALISDPIIITRILKRAGIFFDIIRYRILSILHLPFSYGGYSNCWGRPKEPGFVIKTTEGLPLFYPRLASRSRTHTLDRSKFNSWSG